MKQATKFEVYDGVEVAESPLIRRERSNPYGSVPGLDDEELLDTTELERLFIRQELGPILDLPFKTKRGWIKPTVNEDGKVDWGAFATADFERMRPKFDKVRYKTEKLREELANQRIMLEMISEKIKTKVKYEVIKYVSKGILDLGDISDFNMYCLAERCLRAERLQRQIIELEEKSRKKREQAAKKFWESLERL